VRSPLRVLHVSPYFAPAFRYGGPPRSIFGLCQGLQRAGVEVEVLTTAANGPKDLIASAPGGERYQGVPVRYLPVAFPRRFFGARMATALAEALPRVDLCHIHGLWNVPEWSAARLARAHHVPYVISPRGMLLPAAVRRGWWRKRVAFGLLESTNLRHAALLHATSEQEAEELRRLDLGVPIAFVPNGVDTDAAALAPAGFRRALGISPDAFVIVFLGRKHGIKRLDLLADAFAQLRVTHPSAHLILAGPDEGDLMPGVMRELVAHRAFLHVLDTVTGDDKWALLADADVFVQCSDSESFGLALVEALAAGVPAVVTKTCPWSEIASFGCGFWVEQTAPAIAAAIATLIEDPARRVRMGERASAFVRERYGWDTVARQMVKLYMQAIPPAVRHDVA
jgi:glycosyltransferase involved in cell wall biosynthesis